MAKIKSKTKSVVRTKKGKTKFESTTTQKSVEGKSKARQVTKVSGGSKGASVKSRLVINEGGVRKVFEGDSVEGMKLVSSKKKEKKTKK